MAIVSLDSRFSKLVDKGVEVELVATGFVFTEGPVWSMRDRALIFSDVRTKTMYRWTEADGASVFRQPSGGANGNTFDRNTRLLTCEQVNRRISRTKTDGSVETIVDRFEGKRLNSPNDLVSTANGDVVFTDPTWGLRQPDGSTVGQEYPFCGVFRFSPSTGQIKVLADDFPSPNGLVVTSDESRMYIADTLDENVRLFDIAVDGSLRNGKEFVKLSRGETKAQPDGMKLDTEGNLYVAANTAHGVWVYAPDGALLGIIGLDEPPTNVAWGGDDWQTLFITVQGSPLYRLRMKISGQPVPGRLL